MVSDLASLLVLPVDRPKRLTPTDVTQFVRLEQCERFLRLRLAERAGQDFMKEYDVSGQPGDIFAVRPGGRGDVTKTHMAWHTPRKSGRDQPSPILVGDFMVVVNMAGVATGYDAPTGKELWSERLKGAFSSSPVAVGKRVFFQNEAGNTTVIEPGPELKVVAENTLGAKGEAFRASLIPCGGQWFTRSDKAVYCIGTK